MSKEIKAVRVFYKRKAQKQIIIPVKKEVMPMTPQAIP
jgi:hypothetical protein